MTNPKTTTRTLWKRGLFVVVLIFSAVRVRIHFKVGRPFLEESSSSLVALSAITPNNTISTTSIDLEKKKYLLYFAQSGFANQQICLKNAFTLAQMLDRVLLVPPILPHFGPGSTFSGMLLNKDRKRFKVRQAIRETHMNPFYHYFKRLPVHQYLVMDDVMDMEYSLPGVEKMDVRTFHEQYHRNEMLQRSIELDHGYSHFNTFWMYNDSALEGMADVIVNRTYQDVSNTLGNYSEDIMVFLDSFSVVYHETVRTACRPWRPRLSGRIRQVVLNHIENAELPPYAAIHLRTGDGTFRNRKRMEQSIRHIFANVTILMSQWLSDVYKSSAMNVHNGSTTYQKVHETVGLYVATDLDDFRRHPVFHVHNSQLAESIYIWHGVNVTILSRQEIFGNASQSLDGILNADAFLDIQMAVCATIGFFGTVGSSFSHLIHDHRNSDQECLVGRKPYEIIQRTGTYSTLLGQ